MVASIIGVQSPLNFLLSQVLICYRRSQMSELYHILKPSVTYLYVVILPCTLVTSAWWRPQIVPNANIQHSYLLLGQQETFLFYEAHYKASNHLLLPDDEDSTTL
jgi:hypothetical protein